jgi:tetratricopeptide (TPR) repeat protein
MTIVRVLHGLRTFYFVGGELRIVRELDGQIVEAAARNPGKMTTYLANVAVGTSALWTGELRSAREHIERALVVDENTISAVGAGGGPPIYVAIANLSNVLWMLGYPDQALREQARTLSLLSHPINLFHRAGIIHSLLWARCQFLRDYQGMRQQAEALIALARENGFTTSLGIGLVRLGRILVDEKNFAEGIETMREGMRTLDARLVYANFCCVLAEAYLVAGRTSEGLAVAEEALDYTANGFCQSELHRLKGELLLLTDAPESEAENLLRQGIAIAQRQEAKSWELRAATSLARLLRRQGKVDEARKLLGEIYNWFTEGLDTADLKDAKALLDELSG